MEQETKTGVVARIRRMPNTPRICAFIVEVATGEEYFTLLSKPIPAGRRVHFRKHAERVGKKLPVASHVRVIA